MGTRNSALREQVRAATRAELGRVGRQAFLAKAIIADFGGCGVSTSTLARWVGEALRLGRPEADADADVARRIAEAVVAALAEGNRVAPLDVAQEVTKRRVTLQAS